MDEKDLIEKKKEFMKKIKEELKNPSSRMVKFLKNIEEELEKGGLLTDDIRKVIASTRARIGLPEYIGSSGDASKSKDLLKIDVISTLKANGKFLSITTLKKLLTKKGWEFGALSLEEFLAQMAKKGEIFVKSGYIWIGSLRDTVIGNRFFEHIRKLETVELREICKILNLNLKICEILVNEFQEAGLVTFDGQNVYFVSN